MLKISDKVYLDQSEVEKLLAEAKAKHDLDLKKLADKLSLLDSSAKKTADSIAANMEKLSKAISSVKSVSVKSDDMESQIKALSNNFDKAIKDAVGSMPSKEELHGKIDSSRVTMTENYENHAKSTDKAIKEAVNLIKSSISKIEQDVDAKIAKAENSILKRVLQKISSLMG